MTNAELSELIYDARGARNNLHAALAQVMTGLHDLQRTHGTKHYAHNVTATKRLLELLGEYLTETSNVARSLALRLDDPDKF